MKYSYCPNCGKKYTNIENKNCYKCQNCSYVFYQNPKPAVVALIKNSQGDVLLAKRGVQPYKGYWDLPGGFVDSEENYEEGIRRELQEELGLNSDNLVCKYKGSFTEKYANKGIKRETYTLLIVVFEIVLKDFVSMRAMDDIVEYKFFSLDTLPEDIAFPEKRKFLENLTLKK